ncbi:hypothetical protein [Bradyrhizobium sp.]|uniref:hypothetical protein n=1 Tax=Bradyrhizobium sp. TaxID=376 RepID=UPI003C78EB79
MLRWMTPFLIAVLATGPAAAADGPVATKRAADRAAGRSPPGLPLVHHKYRTTVAPAAPLHRRRVYVETDPELLFTPSSGIVPYIPPVVGAPLLPGSATLPGYYGRASSYDYQGAYYRGRDVSYWNRLPYACGVYGYC